MKFGYNIDVNSVSHDKAIQDCIRSGGNVHTIMTARSNGMAQVDDVNIIWKFHNALYPVYGDDLVLVWRWYTDKEGDWKSLPSSEIYAALLKGFNLPPSVIIDSFSNEPNLNGDSYRTNVEYVEHERKMLQAVRSAGYTYAVGAFGVGFPNETMIERGVYDALLKDVVQYEGVLSLHLYGVFPFESGEVWVWDMMQKTEKNKLIIRETYLDDPISWGGHRGWLLGRFLWLKSRCDSIDIPMPDIYITEGFFDRIGAMPDNINAEWKSDFGSPEYNFDNRGVLTWQKYLKWLFPELSFREILNLIMKYMRSNIMNHEYIKGMTLFGYNRNWGYPDGPHKESGHNWEDEALKEFRQYDMADINGADNGSTLPVFIPVSGTLESTSTSNVRESPETGSAILFELTIAPIMVNLVNNKVTSGNNSYEWYEFIYEGRMVYVANTNRVVFTEAEEIPEEPIYVVDILGATSTLTSTEKQDLVDVFAELIDLVDSVGSDSDDDYFLSMLDSVRDLFVEITETNKTKTIMFLEIIKQAIEDSGRF